VVKLEKGEGELKVSAKPDDKERRESDVSQRDLAAPLTDTRLSVAASFCTSLSEEEMQEQERKRRRRRRRKLAPRA
jgi:hypothetical protein